MSDAVATPIILLDLNFTLVGNSEIKDRSREPYSQKIKAETYRQWLVELVRPYHVILATVRNQRYAEQTLQHIQALTNWHPNAVYFNPTDDYRGFVVKERYLLESIFPTHGRDCGYYAIESSIKTRAMYAKFNIPAHPVPKEGSWAQLP